LEFAEETRVMLFRAAFDLKQRFGRCRLFRWSKAKSTIGSRSATLKPSVATAIAYGSLLGEPVLVQEEDAVVLIDHVDGAGIGGQAKFDPYLGYHSGFFQWGRFHG
jgi:hypothetical protein